MRVDQALHSSKLRGNGYVKAAVLLAVSIFLVSAPAPDASIIADATSNLITSGATHHASEHLYPLS